MEALETHNQPLLTPEIIRKLDHLFSSAHPTHLKNHLTMLLLHFLEHEHDTLPTNFEDLVVDLRILMEFLVVAERELRPGDRVKPGMTKNGVIGQA